MALSKEKMDLIIELDELEESIKYYQEWEDYGKRIGIMSLSYKEKEDLKKMKRKYKEIEKKLERME